MKRITYVFFTLLIASCTKEIIETDNDFKFETNFNSIQLYHFSMNPPRLNKIIEMGNSKPLISLWHRTGHHLYTADFSNLSVQLLETNQQSVRLASKNYYLIKGVPNNNPWILKNINHIEINQLNSSFEFLYSNYELDIFAGYEKSLNRFVLYQNNQIGYITPSSNEKVPLIDYYYGNSPIFINEKFIFTITVNNYNEYFLSKYNQNLQLINKIQISGGKRTMFPNNRSNNLIIGWLTDNPTRFHSNWIEYNNNLVEINSFELVMYDRDYPYEAFITSRDEIVLVKPTPAKSTNKADIYDLNGNHVNTINKAPYFGGLTERKSGGFYKINQGYAGLSATLDIVMLE